MKRWIPSFKPVKVGSEEDKDKEMANSLASIYGRPLPYPELDPIEWIEVEDDSPTADPQPEV